MPLEIVDLFNRIDAVIRDGEIQKASSLLTEVNIPRTTSVEFRIRYAELCRRVNLPQLALRLLNRYVRPQARSPFRASAGEIVEYAASLIRLGGMSEALALLRGPEMDRFPEALLFESFACFSHWDYALAIPHLEKYILFPELTPYQRAVGRANLVAAMVYEKHPSAEATLQAHLTETKTRGYQLLYVNALISLVEKRVFERAWKDATKIIEEATAFNLGPQTLETLFTMKWKFLIDVYRTNGEKGSLEQLERVKSLAVAIQHWETIRNLDYHTAKVTNDVVLWRKLYFGTHYEAFRKRLQKESPVNLSAENDFPWRVPGAPPGNDQRFLETDLNCPVGSQIHRTLLILTSDFYRPIRLAQLHAALYPGEFYNPLTSPTRVYKAVSRFRHFFATRKLPFNIEEHDGNYQFKASHPCILVVKLHGAASSKTHLKLQPLLEHSFPGRCFTAKEASHELGLGLWSTLRLLRSGTLEGIIERIGAGSETRYRFASSDLIKKNRVA